MNKITLLCAGVLISGAVLAQKPATKKAATKTAPAPSGEIKTNVEYTTASGLKYKVLEKGTGTQATSGSTVSVHYTGTLTDGKKFDSSKDRGQPLVFKLGTGRVIKGWEEGIALMRVGDKTQFTIPPQLGYGANAFGPIPANATLIFEVELLDVKEPVKPWDVQSKDTITTASGLKYIVVEKSQKTDAKKAENGKSVEVHYTGFLADGKVFDSSLDRGQPLFFQLGLGMVIKGWEEGIGLMNVGDKFRLIIPSNLGYGEAGYGGGIIPPNATLFFDVELIDVR